MEIIDHNKWRLKELRERREKMDGRRSPELWKRQQQAAHEKFSGLGQK